MIRTFEFDDYPRGADRFLWCADRLHRSFPNFKCTVFAIPAMMTDQHWRALRRRRHWIKVCPHGFVHRKHECRHPGIWGGMLGLLDYVSHDRRWEKCFKAPWYAHSWEFIEMLHERGFSIAAKTMNRVPFPTPGHVQAWCIEDARMSHGFDDLKSNIEAHPVYECPKSHSAKRTEISRRTIRRWRKFWSPDDEWEFSCDLVSPLLKKVNLGCGEQVWDDWLCLDPRDNLDPRIVKWDFSQTIPLGSHRADVVLCSHVFEYLDESEYPAACLEAWRVLRAQGVFRIASVATESGYVWRYPGQNARGTGVIKSLPTKEKIVRALRRVGFDVFNAVPGETRSMHNDVLRGDNRARHYARGRKFYIEAIKAIEMPEAVRRVWKHDPCATRSGRYQLPEEAA